MRDTLLILGIVCAIFGFILHDLWYVAVPSLVISFLIGPSGRRPDGQKKLPGPLGWALDEIIIAIKMKNCPHCGYKVLKKDTICFFCKKEINSPAEIPELETQADDEEAENKEDNQGDKL